MKQTSHSQASTRTVYTPTRYWIFRLSQVNAPSEQRCPLFTDSFLSFLGWINRTFSFFFAVEDINLLFKYFYYMHVEEVMGTGIWKIYGYFVWKFQLGYNILCTVLTGKVVIVLQERSKLVALGIATWNIKRKLFKVYRILCTFSILVRKIQILVR